MGRQERIGMAVVLEAVLQCYAQQDIEIVFFSNRSWQWLGVT